MRQVLLHAATAATALLMLAALPATAATATDAADHSDNTTKAPTTTSAKTWAQGQPPNTPLIPAIDIDYTKFTLDNGLTLVVQEDHSSPIVAVTMWYHVGSKNEGPEQHGFAHLFEHLMFQGTEHWHGEYFEPFERAGATQMNGTTGADRTNYYATVPTPALDMALWMESDRMGHLLGGIDQAALDEQVGVVLNEKRQGANQPYGKVWRKIPTNTYPQSHPYSWPTIGSTKDLKAATLDDVRAWFKTYYGPTNATLVLAGDITPQAALKKVKHYFGDIPAGPPLTRQSRWVAPMNGEHRLAMRDRVPHARIYMLWNVPPMGAPTSSQLQLAGNLLAGSKNSVLYQALVMDKKLALNVNAGLIGREIGSQFIITATARPGVPLAKVEQAITDTLQKFLQTGPQTKALQRSKTRIAAGFMRSIAGVSGKAQVLARGQVYYDNPAHFQQDLDILRAATPATVQAAADQWLTDDHFVLSVLPFGKHSTHDTNVDRSQLPDIGKAPNLTLPNVQTATLPNGLKIRLAEQHETPIVEMNMVFDAGYAADPDHLPGLANMTLAMLDEGAGKRDSLAVSAALDDLGATFSTNSSLDASVIGMSALANRLAPSMALYADIMLQPTFPQAAFERLKRQALAGIAQEKNTPTSLALRKLGPLLYGADHDYGIPLTGSGTVAAVKAMTIADMQQFAHTWLRPDNATLVIVGDTTMAAIKPLLKRYFGDWQAPEQPLPVKHIAKVPRPNHSRVFLLDRPGSTQTTIIAGDVAPPKSSPWEYGMNAANTLFGGMFNSRLNMILREAKHWSYGAGSALVDAKAQQPFFIYTSVQTDKSADAMQVIHDQIRALLGSKPPTASELQLATANLTRTLPGHNETSAQLAGTLTNRVVYDLPAHYYDTYVSKMQALTPDEVETAAHKLLAPGAMTWIVVGDLTQIGDAVRALDWVSVSPLDEQAPAATPDSKQ